VPIDDGLGVSTDAGSGVSSIGPDAAEMPERELEWGRESISDGRE
jgi:hypothetical protein